MNIPRSKNTKGSINETLHSHLRRYKKSTVKEYMNTWIFLVLKTPVKEDINT